jgi:hypothetical protein
MEDYIVLSLTGEDYNKLLWLVNKNPSPSRGEAR